MGVHRFTFDGRYAYISAELDGYVGTIVMILDRRSDPTRGGRALVDGGPMDRGRRNADWKGRNHRCHHPIRRGDRLYVSYWYGGGVILDISDMSKPRMISGLDWRPPFGWPTHSLVPIDVRSPAIAGCWSRTSTSSRSTPTLSPELPAMVWMVNITDETRPIPGAVPAAGTRRGEVAADDRLPSAGRNHHRQRGPGGVVRQRIAGDRHLPTRSR